MASFATRGERGEREQLVLLQFQGEGAVAAQELKGKTPGSQGCVHGSPRLWKSSFQKLKKSPTCLF